MKATFDNVDIGDEIISSNKPDLVYTVVMKEWRNPKQNSSITIAIVRGVTKKLRLYGGKEVEFTDFKYDSQTTYTLPNFEYIKYSKKTTMEE